MTEQPVGEAAAPERPLFVVEAGNPTPQEIAALTVVLAAATSGGGEAATSPVNNWSSPARNVRQIGQPGPGAWRAQFAPR